MKGLKIKDLPDSIVYLLSDILIKAIAFLTLPFFLRFMSTSDYGEFNVYQSYTSFFGVFFALNISKGIVRYYVEKENRNTYLGTAIWINIVVGLAFSLLLLAEESIFHMTKLSTIGLLLVCVTTIASSFRDFILEDLRARMEAKKYGLCGISISVISTAIGLLLVSQRNEYLGLLRFLSTGIPLFLLAIFTTIYIFKRDTSKFDVDTCKYLLSYSIPLIPYTLSTTIIAEINKIVFSSIGFSEVGVYSFAVNLSGIIYVTVISINRAYQPYLFQALRDNKSSMKRLKQNIFLYFLAYYFFLLLLNVAIRIFGNEEYFATSYIAPIITAGYGYFFLYTLSVNYYYYYKRNWIISAIALGSAVIIGISSYLLIPKFGYIGAALSTLIAYFSMYLFGTYYLKRWMKKEVFSLKHRIVLQFAIIVPAVLKVIFEFYRLKPNQ